MKRLGAFFKATTLGGLFVVLPVVVVLGLLTKAVVSIRGVAQSLMVKLAGEGTEVANFPVLFALLIVVAISFFFGLVMISRRGQATDSWLQQKLLSRLPGYSAVRALVGGFADSNREGVIKPGLLRVDPGIEAFVFVLEDHGDDNLTVFIPGSPNPASGNVQIVHKDLVRMLNVRITDIGSSLRQWGMGSAKVLAKDHAPPPATSSSTRS